MRAWLPLPFSNFLERGREGSAFARKAPPSRYGCTQEKSAMGCAKRLRPGPRRSSVQAPHRWCGGYWNCRRAWNLTWLATASTNHRSQRSAAPRC